MPRRPGRERTVEGQERSTLIPSQRVILGAGLAILLIITAASIGLDVKSRSDAAWVNHTVEVLKKISDLRLLLRQAESTARGFEIYRTASFADEFRATQDRVAPTLADLERAVRDNRDQVELVKTTVPLVRRRFDIAAEAMRLRAADDQAGIAALQGKAEGRGLMDVIIANLDWLAAGEEKLLAGREAN